MPAHLRKIINQCGQCNRQATHELRNTWNDLIGFYCDKHKDQALEIALAMDKR